MTLPPLLPPDFDTKRRCDPQVLRTTYAHSFFSFGLFLLTTLGFNVTRVCSHHHTRKRARFRALSTTTAANVCCQHDVTNDDHSAATWTTTTSRQRDYDDDVCSKGRQRTYNFVFFFPFCLRCNNLCFFRSHNHSDDERASIRGTPHLFIYFHVAYWLPSTLHIPAHSCT